MVQDIIFHIKKHQLTVETYPRTLVANSVNYLQAVFIFDDYNQKDFCWAKPEGAEKYFIHAEFSWNGVNKWTELIIKDGIAKVNVPWEVTKAPGFSVSVFSTEYEGNYADKKIKKRITTRPIPIILNASGDINGSAGTPYSDEVNLLMLVDEAYSYSQSAYALALEAKSKVDYLEDKVEQKQVSVGGVNILSNSRNIPLYSNDSSKWPIKKETIQERNRIFERYRRVNTNLNPGTLSFYNNIYYKDFTEDISGIYVTFSFLARANMNKTASLMMYASDPEGGVERIDFSPVTETIVFSPEWKRYSYSIKLDHIFTQSAIIRFCPFDVYFSNASESSQFYLDICEWKVERGTVATDWTPSLVETEQQITEVKTSLREEVDKIISEVEGNVSTLEGDFKKINSQVQTLESSTSYISNEAYGANILIDSGLYTFTPERWDSRTGFEITDDGAKITSGAGMLSQSILGKLEKDTIYTASIKVKVVKPSSTGYLRILDNGVYQGSWFACKSKDIPITSAHGWRTYHFTFTTDYRIPAASRYYYIVDWQKISDTAEIYFKELKLEKGAWPTAWSDDAQANKRVYSKIEQTVNGLKAELGGNEADKATNYLSFTAEGLVIGNMKTEILGGNVRIGTVNNKPVIELRDNKTAYASFSANKIQLGADLNESQIILGQENNGLIITRKKVVIIPETIIPSLIPGGSSIVIPELSISSNTISSFALTLETPVFNIKSDIDLSDTKDSGGILQKNKFILDHAQETGDNILLYGESILGEGGLKILQNLPYREEYLEQYNTGLLTSLSSSYGDNFAKDNDYCVDYPASGNLQAISRTFYYKNLDSQLLLFPSFLELVNFNGYREDGTGVLNGIKISEKGVALLRARASVGDSLEKEELYLCYKDGDEIDLSWFGNGYITNSATEVRCSVPLSKIVPNDIVAEARIVDNGTRTKVYIRHEGNYLWRDSKDNSYVSSAYIEPTVNVSQENTDGNYLNMTFNFMGNTEDKAIVNNHACGVEIRKLHIKFKKKNS